MGLDHPNGDSIFQSQKILNSIGLIAQESDLDRKTYYDYWSFMGLNNN